MRFTKDMRIYDVLQAHPRARDVLVRHGMGCVACLGSTMESVESGAKMHGVDPDAVLVDLNSLEEEKDRADNGS